ncbi:hypothetical protein BJ508DRAFT_304726 [Ascobolus immersus RN42]|uniref:Uncharacterized protein n=1 Tax=Ascobolus immersus RN42 TaxID=1160509 RepID=A0A3N4IFT1_ASCIM|nr:hypothetical protein BJ508DRAFT_304726 [Ascobolus immersus RN42]
MASEGPAEPRKRKTQKTGYRKPRWINLFANLEPEEQAKYAFKHTASIPSPEDVRYAEQMFFPHLTSRRYFRNLFLIAPQDPNLRYALMRTDRFDGVWKEFYFKAYGGIDHFAFPIQSSPGRLGVLSAISRYLAIHERIG